MNSIHNFFVSIHQYVYPKSMQKKKELKLFEIEYNNTCELCKRDLRFKERNIIELSDEMDELSPVSELAYKIENRYQVKFDSPMSDFSDQEIF